jgi:hypothetical protein
MPAGSTGPHAPRDCPSANWYFGRLEEQTTICLVLASSATWRSAERPGYAIWDALMAQFGQEQKLSPLARLNSDTVRPIKRK